MLIKRISIAPLIALMLLVLSVATTARAEGEQQSIERLNGLLLETMQQGPDLGYEGRFKKLEGPLNELFDFRAMIQIGLQRHWATIAEADRDAIVRAFARMSVATFARRFDDHNGEAFEVTSIRPGPRSLVLVSTEITRAGKENVDLTYVVRSDRGSPQIIDILAQGKFSELARQRAELSAVFTASGVAGLIASLDRKASDLATD